jgi:hypothetical protein
MQAGFKGEMEYSDLRWVVRICVTVFASMVFAGIVLATNGILFVPPALAIGIGVTFFLIVRPNYGFAILVGVALLLEQFNIGGLETPVTFMVPFFLNLNLSMGIPGAVVNPVEILLGMFTFSWIMNMIVTRRFQFQRIPNIWALLLIICVIVGFLGYGMARHGDFKAALWEIRAIFYLFLCYLIGSQVIRTRKDIVIVVWATIIAIAIKGYQGMYRYVIELGCDLGEIPAITGHEDAVFMVMTFIFTASLLFFGGPKKMIWFGLITFPTTMATFILTQRRVAYGAVVFGIIILFCFLPKEKKKFFINMSIPCVIMLMLYFAAFWNSNSGAATLVKQVRSVFGEKAEEDRSNLYRKIENYNLQETIKVYPQGIGFGKKYMIIIPLDEIDFPLWEYIPHNCVLWFWVKTGFFGFWAFFMFWGITIVQCSLDFRRTYDPLYKSIQVLVIVFIVGQLIVSKYDLQLTFYRNMIYLGTILALTVPCRILGGAEAREKEFAWADENGGSEPCR